MNISGLFSKIESKADWAAFIAEAWEAIPSYTGGGNVPVRHGIAGMIDWFLCVDPSRGGALNELKNSLTWPGLLEEKLKSNHLYAAALKYGAAAWLLQELGFLTQYRGATEKVLKASALALLVLPGSGPYNVETKSGRRGEQLVNPSANPQYAGAY